LTGLSVEAPFARGLFDKLGVTADFRQRHEYKSAPETFTRTDFSAPAREATEALLASEFSQIVRGIAQTRRVSEEQIRGWVNQAPLSATQALEAKLIDGISYRDEVYEKVFGGKHVGAKPLYLSTYLKRLSAPRHRPTVALIFGTGQVERSSAESSEFDDDDTMRSGRLAAQFRKAVADEDVKAIVFRVDSPGGSYIASDTIRREVANARKKGKPVVVSMGNVAASGGYFVAMDADKVVANPGTITGSIGVFAGKFITRDLWAKLGVNFTTLSRGEMSTFWSSDQPFTPLQSKRLDAWLDFVYDDFTKKAAAGRQMPLEKVLEVAKGRVWTGEDAQRLGLVDVLGGLLTARALATEAAGLAGQAVDLVVYPDERPAFERVLQVLAGDGAESSEEEGQLDARILSMRGFQKWGASWLRRTMGLHTRGPLHSDVPEVRW
ncbi:MAG: signal peptide peptidase SppA, partial [Myxococcaceae bacterium]